MFFMDRTKIELVQKINHNQPSEPVEYNYLTNFLNILSSFSKTFLWNCGKKGMLVLNAYSDYKYVYHIL